MKDLSPEIKKSFIVWTICLSSFILLIFINNVLKGTFLKNFLDSSLVGMLVIGIVLGGVVSFLFFLVSSISYFLKKGNVKKRNIAVKIVKILLIILILPLLLLFEALKPLQLIKLIIKKKAKDIFSKQFFKNYAFSLLIILFLFPLWGFIYFIPIYISTNMLGFISSPIPIAGTGSMYPTFPKSSEKDLIKQSKDIIGLYDFMPYPNGLVLFGKRYFGYELHRGDIVLAINEKIKENSKKLYGESSGVVKRIIALPGDSLEIRSGLVYLNSKPLIESYTAKSHSTFGEGFLGECKKITIPQNKLFIMGDNRKGSGDSREFGSVDFNDVKSVIPFQKQKGKLDKNYRDTLRDLSDSTKIKLDKTQYLELLNSKRNEAGVKSLKYQPLLEKSADKRGEIILEYNDFSFEATKSGVTMQRSMADVGYSNITYGEAPTQGYFEAEELIDNQFQYPKTKEFLLNKDNQEVGIAEVEGEINGCPTQVIVQHFAGYVPPNYSQATIDGWQKTLSRLIEIQPSWSRLKDNSSFYQSRKQDVDRINEIISIRIANLQAVVNKMKSNQWLTKQENDYTYQDEALYKEQEVITTRLNSQ